MKKMNGKLLRSTLALLLVVCMVLPSATPVHAVEFEGDKINYVALGSSVTAGFGLEGYNPDNLGYNSAPADSYPSQLKGSLEKQGYTVSLSQLGFSGLRIEELRLLLDEEYTGDDYTQWRFNAEGTGLFTDVHPQGLQALRKEYTDAIKKADLITIDLGADNFCEYLINQLSSKGTMFEVDMNKVMTSQAVQSYTLYKGYIVDMVQQRLQGLDQETLSLLTDTMLYIIMSYCTNFDAAMDAIYTLNPDVKVAIVSCMNPMEDLQVAAGDNTVDFGEVCGVFVDMVNYYTSYLSKHAQAYWYVDMKGTDTYIDEIAAYNGDASRLSQGILDCFNIYDENLMVQTRVQKQFLDYLRNNGFQALITIPAEADGDTTEHLKAFAKAVNDGSVTVMGMPMKQFLEKGEKNQLAEYQMVYNIYVKMLKASYDAVAQFIAAGAGVNTLDMSIVTSDFNAIGNELIAAMHASVAAGIQKITTGEDYAYDVDAEILSDPAKATALALIVRFSVGNRFFSHPNAAGHTQIKNAIVHAMDYDIRGSAVAEKLFAQILTSLIGKDAKTLTEATHADYKPNANSFYVNLGDGAGAGKKDTYVHYLAEKLGLTDNQYKNLATKGDFAMDSLADIEANKDLIGKSDLVTLGFTTNTFTDRVVEQLEEVINKRDPEPLNWSELVSPETEEAIAYMMQYLNDRLVEKGLGANYLTTKYTYADIVTIAMENYLYLYYSHITYYPQLIEAIHAENPNALVVLVGVNNPADDLILYHEDPDTKERTDLNLGSYVQLCAAAVRCHQHGLPPDGHDHRECDLCGRPQCGNCPGRRLLPPDHLHHPYYLEGHCGAGYHQGRP